jgi:hypothetical protein
MQSKINKKGQVTIFIIVAIVIVGGIIAYFSLKDNLKQSIPSDMEPVYDYYISCLEASTEQGIKLLGEQGGYIDLPDFEPGSPHIPFSSQLSFFGQAVPYWMYVSGNNFLKEQIPSKQTMETQLNDYVNERLTNCDFEDFEKMGYSVYIEDGETSSAINNLDVKLNVKNKITIFKGDISIVINNHEFSLESKLGKFYDMAIKVYDYEKSDMFLEKYALDVMRLYAPVDGVELGCAPKLFVDENIRKDLYEGLELNMNSIKLDGDYYKLSSQEREYFVSDVGFQVDENVNIMYNPTWPTKIEIYGDKIVKPIGVQPGLSALGFCYTPYHLVYDISFPVMIQFYDTENFFQFPVGVVIDNSQAREALPSSFGSISMENEVCRYKNSDIKIYTYDSELSPVEARIQFKCLDSICEVGNTELSNGDAVYNGGIPQCVNGFIMASSKGYLTSKFEISTNSEDVANIILKKEYDVGLDMGEIDKMVVVNFVGEDYSTTVIYPETESVKLVEGEYEISAYIYENSTLELEGYDKRMCVDVPASGAGGLIGLEEEKCYDVNVPAMQIDMAVIGGGQSNEYIAESILQDSTKLKLNIPLFDKPNSIEDLQKNYEEVENSIVSLEFE